MRKLLLQLDSSPHPSVFDRVVALDAGADMVMSYGGVTEESVRDLKSAHRLAPARPEILLGILAKLPPFEASAEMQQLARRAVALAPGSADAHRFLAVALAHDPAPARWDEARDEFLEASRLNILDARALIELGRLEARRGRDAEAAGHLEKAWRRLELRRPGRAL